DHLPTLESLVDYGCCMREGDQGLVTAKTFLKSGGPLRPALDDYGRALRSGTGRVMMVAQIGNINSRIDPETISGFFSSTNRATVPVSEQWPPVKRVRGGPKHRPQTVSLENLTIPYQWYCYPVLIAEGELPPGVTFDEAEEKITKAMR